MPELLSYALCSQEAAQQWLRLVNPSDDETAVLQTIINAVTRRFERVTCRQIFARDLTSRLDGTGVDHIYLPQWPVVEVSLLRSLDRAGEVYETYDASKVYVSETGRLQLLNQNAFPHGAKNIEITYQPGWASIPDDVAVAALQWVADWYTTWAKAREPIASVSVNGQTTTFFNEEIPKKVKAVVDLYTLPAWAGGS